MRNNVEGDLARTLEAVFDAAPAPAPAFPDAVAGVRRRRRRRRNAALATVLAVISAGAVALRPGDGPVVDFAAAADVRQVWPEAVVTLPGRLPGNVRYEVEAALGGDTYLIEPSGGGPALLDGSTGETRPLESGTPVSGLDVTPHYVAWSVPAGAGLDVYAQRRDGGGEAAYLGRVPDTNVAVAEADGVFYATGSTKHGNAYDLTLYRMTAGEAPAEVPQGKGFALVSGAWAVRGVPGPGAANRLPGSGERDPSPARVLTEPRTAPAFWNVATGRSVTPVSRAAILSCTPEVCVGQDDGSLVTWAADGSDEVRSTGFTMDRTDRADAFFSSSGRFVQVTTRTPGEATSVQTSNHLWDRATGTVATAHGTMRHDVIDLGSDGDKTVLDLTRVL